MHSHTRAHHTCSIAMSNHAAVMGSWWPHPPQVVSCVAGGLAGALTATFVCPLDVLKTRLQVQRRVPGVHYQGISGLRPACAAHTPPLTASRSPVRDVPPCSCMQRLPETQFRLPVHG